MSVVTPKYLKLLVSVALVLAVLAGCGAPAAPAAPGAAEAPAAAAPAAGDTTLRIPINVNVPAPDIWNPYIPGTFILQGMNQVLMEPLFLLNYETGNVDGWLAESFSSNEAQDEWTVTLRPGTEWSDGTPLTAEDVVFTIELLAEYAPQLNWSGAVQQWVESVEAVDDRTVKFTLTASNPRFVIENLAGTISQSITPLPKHVWEGQDPVTFRNEFDEATGAPVFSGPYKVLRFSSTEYIYVRNDDWWGAKTGAFKLPEPTEVHYLWMQNQETISQKLIANELDLGGAPTLSVAQSILARNDELRHYDTESPYAWRDPCPRMFTINHTVEPWGNPEMRWALSYAFNRQQMADVIHEGATVPASFVWPDYPSMQPFYDAVADVVAPVAEYNPDKARELIEANGYTLDAGTGKYVGADGAPLQIDVVAPPFMEPVARLVVQQLNEIGIDAVLQIIEWGIFRDQTGRGQFEGATDWSGCGSVTEPWFGMNRYNKSWVNPVGTPGTEYVDNTNNSGRWVNDEYSTLVDQMGVLPVGDPAVVDLMKQAMDIWVAELPAIPLIQQPALLIFNEARWTNWPTKDNNYIQPPSHWHHFLRVLTELELVQ